MEVDFHHLHHKLVSIAAYGSLHVGDFNPRHDALLAARLKIDAGFGYARKHSYIMMYVYVFSDAISSRLKNAAKGLIVDEALMK